MPIEPDTLYTVRDAARLIGIGRNEAYAEIRSGRLACLRIGPGARRIKVRGRACLAYLEDCEGRRPEPRPTQSTLPARSRGPIRVPKDHFARPARRA